MPKKILIILYYYYPYVSGLSEYAKRLAEGLVSKGYSITVLTTQFEKYLPREEKINGVKVIRCPIIFRLNKGVISPNFLYKMLVLPKHFNIINFHLPLTEAGFVSLFIKSKKIISTYQCDINLGDTLSGKLIEKISFFLMNIALTRSKKIVVLSYDYFKSSKMKKYINKAIEIIPPVDTSKFYKVKSDVLRKKLKIKPNEFIIGFVGRIVYEKGISYLLQAINYLNQIDNFKIVIAGDYKRVAGGSIKKEFDKYIKKYPNKIIFTGFLPDNELLQFYSMINVLVLPSIDPLEAFGIVQVEAMCCGVPVIASDLPGVRTIVQKTNFGYIAKRKNAKDIAHKIMLIHNNKYSAKGFIKEDWDIKKNVDSYVKLFRHVNI